MDESDRQAYLEDCVNPDDPAVIARHKFAIQAVMAYGIAHSMKRQRPPALAD